MSCGRLCAMLAAAALACSTTARAAPTESDAARVAASEAPPASESVAVVARGVRVRPLPVAGRRIGAVEWTRNGRRWTIDQYMQATHVSGVIVLRNGEIVLERYAMGRTAADRWVSQSVAKSVTSLLAGAAIADGRISLADPIVRYVPELAGSAYEGVTFRQLLMMSSGVAWKEAYEAGDSDLAKFYAFAATGDAIAGYLGRLPRAHPPGSVFHYNTAEAHLAGLVVSRAAGMPLARYLSEKIWAPYGMERDALWITDRSGRAAAGCCLFMTLRDFARLGEFALDGGVIDGRPVVAPGWIAQSTRVQIANGRPAPFGYGYLWWIGPEAYEASGIYGQSILVYPKDRIVIAINSAWDKPDDPDSFAAIGAFEEALRAAANPASSQKGPQP
jgi:CubicO group peptidase (beta-lactamase class C family)